MRKPLTGRTVFALRAYIVSKPFHRTASSAPSEGHPTTSDGTLANPPPTTSTPDVSQNDKPIPLYAADGRCVAWRSLEDAQYRVATGFYRPSYGRKGHLKAVWLLRDDRTSPVEAQVAAGTRYSYLERLDCGRRCWKLRRVTQHAAALPTVDQLLGGVNNLGNTPTETTSQ